jgi:hypothetical protein
MNKELGKKIDEIIKALESTSENVNNMCSGNASRDAALYKSMLFKIKEEMIPKALELCEEGEYEPKHLLNKIDRNIWAMDYTILSRMSNNMIPETINYLSQWIHRYASDLKHWMKENG